jgi:DNA-directed RNA polymerase subunit F
MFWALLSGGMVVGELIWEHFLKEKAQKKLPVHLVDLIDIALLTSAFVSPTATSIQHFRALPTVLKLAKGSKKVKEAIKKTGLGLVFLGVGGVEGKKLYEGVKEFNEHLKIEKERQELLKKLLDLQNKTLLEIKSLERQQRYYEEIKERLRGYLEKKGVIILPVLPETESELKYNLEEKKKKGKGVNRDE